MLLADILSQNILDWFRGNAVFTYGSMQGEHLSITDWIWMWLKKKKNKPFHMVRHKQLLMNNF